MPKRVPGSRGKKIPGTSTAKLPHFNTGRFLTRIRPRSTSKEWGELHQTRVRDSRGRFAGGTGFAWQGLEAMAQNIVAATHATMADIESTLHQIADEMVQYAQTNHVWKNRTGAAEEGLQAQVVQNSPDSWTIFLGHGPDVYYGIWLEVRWGGKYAIILPTLQKFAPAIGADAVRPGA